MIQFGIFLAIILYTLIMAIYTVEKSSNDQFASWFDALWYTLVTITTVGYGDIYPKTFAGKLIGISILMFGVIMFGAVSGKIASVLFGRQLKLDRGLIKLKKIKNHFLICGWKQGFEYILDGVLAANPEIPLEHIVLINTISTDQMEKIKSEKRFQGINYINGDFSDEATLLRANVKTASRALILSDYSSNYSSLEIDSRTVLAVLTIENLNSRIYVAAELIDNKFEKHLAIAHCDEIILSSDYERSLLVSASSGTGISHVIKELITETSGEGLAIEDIPESFIGKTFKELGEYFSGKAAVIGLLENTGNFYYRRMEALSEAQKNPNMKTIVKNLQKVKNLKSNLPVLAPNANYIITKKTKAIVVFGKKNTDDTVKTVEALNG